MAIQAEPRVQASEPRVQASQVVGADAIPEPEARAQRSPLGSITHGVLSLLSTQPITWAASLLATIFLPRYLQDTDFGQLGVALAISGLTGTIVSLGMTTSLTRGVAVRPHQVKVDASAALVLLVGLSVVATAGISLAWPIVAEPIGPGTLLPLALVGMVLAQVTAVLGAVLVGQQRTGWYAWINAAMTAISVVVGIAVLMSGGSLTLYLASGVATCAIVSATGWYLSGLGFSWGAARWQHFARLAREGLPFLGWSVVSRLRNDGDIILLGTLLTQQAVGWYSAAMRIAGIPIFIPTLITTPLLPALSRCANNRAEFERTLRTCLWIMTLLTIPASVLVAAVAPAIPGLLGWDPVYEHSVPLIQINVLSLPLISVGMVLGVGLYALGDERRWLGVGAATTVLSLLLNVVLMQVFERWVQNGAVGVGVVRMLTELMMIGGAIILLPSGTIDWSTYFMALRITIAALCLGIVVSLLLTTSIILAVIAGGMSFLAVAVIVGAVRPRDLLAMRDLLADIMARREIRLNR